MRKRNPSPTPSALSSTSSASAEQHRKLQLIASAGNSGGNGSQSLLVNHSKFGADSPHAVKKLLSLSEQGNGSSGSKSGSGRNKANREVMIRLTI